MRPNTALKPTRYRARLSFALGDHRKNIAKAGMNHISTDKVNDRHVIEPRKIDCISLTLENYPVAFFQTCRDILHFVTEVGLCSNSAYSKAFHTHLSRLTHIPADAYRRG